MASQRLLAAPSGEPVAKRLSQLSVNPLSVNIEWATAA